MMTVILKLIKLILSYILSPIILFLAHLRKIPENKRILIIQRQKIGDMVCTTPVFREIKNKYPNSYVCIITIPKNFDLLVHNPHVDEIIILPALKNGYKIIPQLIKKHFDWSFDFSPSLDTILLTLFSLIKFRIAIYSVYATISTKLAYPLCTKLQEYKPNTEAELAYLNSLKFIGIKKYTAKREVFINESSMKEAEDILKKYGLNPKKDRLIGILPFAGVTLKEWEKEKFIKLMKELIKRYKAKIFIFGSKEEEPRISQWEEIHQQKENIINLVGKLNLLTTSALLKNMHLVIGADVGPLYIADALNVKNINIAGPSQWQEQRTKNGILITQNYCTPCFHAMKGAFSCKRNDRICIKSITVEEVLNHAYFLLEKESKLLSFRKRK